MVRSSLIPCPEANQDLEFAILSNVPWSCIDGIDIMTEAFA